MNPTLSAFKEATEAALAKERARLACPGCGVPCWTRRGRHTGLVMIFHTDGKRCFFATNRRGHFHMGAGRTLARALVQLRRLGREYGRKTL